MELEKARLVKAIREMRELPVVADEYTTGRIDEHKRWLEEVEDAIATIKKEIEARGLRIELEVAKGNEAMQRYHASRRESATGSSGSIEPS